MLRLTFINPKQHTHISQQWQWWSYCGLLLIGIEILRLAQRPISYTTTSITTAQRESLLSSKMSYYLTAFWKGYVNDLFWMFWFFLWTCRTLLKETDSRFWPLTIVPYILEELDKIMSTYFFEKKNVIHQVVNWLSAKEYLKLQMSQKS